MKTIIKNVQHLLWPSNSSRTLHPHNTISKSQQEDTSPASDTDDNGRLATHNYSGFYNLFINPEMFKATYGHGDNPLQF